MRVREDDYTKYSNCMSIWSLLSIKVHRVRFTYNSWNNKNNYAEMLDIFKDETFPNINVVFHVVFWTIPNVKINNNLDINLILSY